MADDPKDDDKEDFDADTLAAFTKLFEKVAPEWHKKQTQSQKDTKSLEGPTMVGPSLSLEAFLQNALAEQKTEAKTLREKLEEIREILTPEQLTLLRSRKSESGGESRLLTKKEPQEPQKEPVAPAKKKPGWL